MSSSARERRSLQRLLGASLCVLGGVLPKLLDPFACHGCMKGAPLARSVAWAPSQPTAVDALHRQIGISQCT
eukprot:4292879-Prymnesium_polylepis.3